MCELIKKTNFNYKLIIVSLFLQYSWPSLKDRISSESLKIKSINKLELIDSRANVNRFKYANVSSIISSHCALMLYK